MATFSHIRSSEHTAIKQNFMSNANNFNSIGMNMQMQSIGTMNQGQG